MRFTVYCNGHNKNVFDEESGCMVLVGNGLTDVGLRDFDPVLDMEGRNYETIYAKGYKPNY